MNGQTLVDEVREARRTELDRLKSEKALLAATAADLSGRTVLRTVALSLSGLRSTLEGWAAEADAGPASEAFADAAVTLGAECERVVAELDAEPSGDPPVPIPTVRAFDRPPERVGAAFVGHGLVFDGLLLQAVSFFVNEAETRRADLVRGLRSAATDRVGDGASALDSLCADDGDWERARAAATGAVDAAYADYAETLDGMGIDPKPVC
jgi:hypothetical protein